MSAETVATALLVEAHLVLCVEFTFVSMLADANTVFSQHPMVHYVTALNELPSGCVPDIFSDSLSHISLPF